MKAHEIYGGSMKRDRERWRSSSIAAKVSIKTEWKKVKNLEMFGIIE